MKNILCATVLFFLALFQSEAAHAAQGACSTTIRLLAESKDYSSAHLLDLLNYSGCSSACIGNNGRRAYIEFSDDHLYGLALTAAANGYTIGIAYETAAPAKGSNTHLGGVVTCKVKGIWYPG